MSSCLVMHDGENAIICSDSAISSYVNNKLTRFYSNKNKVHELDKYVLFCSGNEKYVFEIEKHISQNRKLDLNDISNIIRNMNMEESVFFNLEILAISKTSPPEIYSISEYNNFIISKLPFSNISITLYSAGFKTKEIIDILEKRLLETQSIKSSVIDTYKEICSEEIGGFLNAWLIKKNGKVEKFIDNVPIDSEKYYLHSVVGDVIVGKILAGNTLTISNDNNNFILDETGATLNNAKFNIQTINTQVIIDPTANRPFRILRNEGGTWVDKFWVNNAGNVNFAGTLSGANGTFSGTLTATTGNIGTLVIDANGLKTSDGNNFLKGNGDFKWGQLSIIGGTATFTGDIYANKIVGQIVNTQVADGAISDGKISTGLSAGKITTGTMSGNRLYGGNPAFNGITPIDSDLAIYGNLQVVGGGFLSQGNITSNGLVFAANGYYSVGGSGISTTRSINTPLGTRTITFSGGICVGFS